MTGAFLESPVWQLSKDSVQEKKELDLQHSVAHGRPRATDWSLMTSDLSRHTEALIPSVPCSREVAQSKSHLKNIHRHLCSGYTCFCLPKTSASWRNFPVLLQMVLKEFQSELPTPTPRLRNGYKEPHHKNQSSYNKDLPRESSVTQWEPLVSFPGLIGRHQERDVSG